NKTTFPDVEPDYWAQPFIQKLASQNIIAGYPDGTFQPEQAVERDEFAAMIRDAFNQNEVRKIASGSVFKDVSADYWAASAIEEAYEAKFMNDFAGGYFRPREEVSRLQALVALVRGLNLSPEPTTASTERPTTQKTQKPKAMPLAILSLMQPAVKAIGTLNNISAKTPPATASRPPATIAASNYYQDAAQIPQDAVDEVAIATQANIVVNYPDVKVLNPNQLLREGRRRQSFIKPWFDKESYLRFPLTQKL
ncbi:MAG: S-layer homology domain-containing protein, partial [Hydrococcus sp. RM1_1_31]|nr:S-layer homology domain-containing protein [Hydrococcus sp. RM1_1_31]